MAITGHTTSKEVSRYTKASRQKVLAEQAFDRFKKEGETEIIVPLLEAEKSGGTKPVTKLLKNNDIRKNGAQTRDPPLPGGQQIAIARNTMVFSIGIGLTASLINRAM